MSNIRDELKKAAIFLFARKGYNGTSVREIVEKAKTTKPCLYYYFKSKEGIYLSILKETLEEFLKILSQNFEEEKMVSRQLKKLCFSVYEKFKEKKDILRLIHSFLYGPPKSAPKFNFESFHKVFYEAIIEKINIAIEKGEFFDQDREAMAFCVMSVFNGVAEMEIAFPKKYDYEKLLDKTLNTLFEGFSRRKK
jgi:AcrR family transcriptional regulator